MLLGLDFDNTIVSYDRLFHVVAVEQGLVPHDLAATKLAVRDHLRSLDQEDAWTEMQGYVYGKRMAEAEAFEGVREFLRTARQTGVHLAIVSHKTQHPFIGPRYDLHAAAQDWVDAELVDAEGPLIDADSVYFELTKEEKFARIKALDCDFFVDDLPEILCSPAFPARTRAVLFDPARVHASDRAVMMVNSWGEMACLLRNSPS